MKGREANRSFPDEAEKDVNTFTPIGPYTVQQREVLLFFSVTRIPTRVFMYVFKTKTSMVLNSGQSTGEDEDIIWQAELF